MGKMLRSLLTAALLAACQGTQAQWGGLYTNPPSGGGGAGSGTVSAATTGQLAVYTGATTVGGQDPMCSITGTLAAGSQLQGTGAGTCAFFTPGSALQLNQSGAVSTNYAGSSCSAGQVVTAVSAAGVATCSASISGFNAGTATALAANGANCSAGNYPLGVDASGAVENCTAAVTTSSTDTLTNKRITKRVGTTTSSGTPTINSDNVDMYGLTAQAAAITSFTTNLSGTPTNGQTLWIYIVGTGTFDITWGASFESSAAVTLPTTGAITTTRSDLGFVWNAATSKWRLIAKS